ncbi:hypothetical protein JW868_03685 [Candidatus Woesearchaeota archaeon]|nr:hypothetical protein [Candidatus Woesearchaeota archaeon]
MKDMIEAIKDVEKLVPSSSIVYNHPGFKGGEISFKRFLDVQNSKKYEQVLFVDGGQALLFESPQVCIAFLRRACATYPQKKSVINECYVLVQFRQGKYYVSSMPEHDCLTFNISEDSPDFRKGNNNIEIGEVASIARRLFELDFVQSNDGFTDEGGCCVVLDGSLESRWYKEKEILDKLSVHVVGLSKTSNIRTSSGHPVGQMLNSMQKGDYLYGPVAEAETSFWKPFFAKLHPKSKHSFRLDCSPELVEQVYSSLKEHCNDPYFLGYPYPLVLVDKLARVSNNEKMMLKTKLEALLPKSIYDQVFSLDAHENLDR